jgi:hypothetical protein
VTFEAIETIPLHAQTNPQIIQLILYVCHLVGRDYYWIWQNNLMLAMRFSSFFVSFLFCFATISRGRRMGKGYKSGCIVSRSIFVYIHCADADDAISVIDKMKDDLL